MTDTDADHWIVVSAVTVAGVYFYRKLTDSTGAVPQTTPARGGKDHSVVGAGRQAPLGRWLVGFGVAYFGISLLASVSPELGAWMAILLMAGTILANGMALAADVNAKVTS